MTDEERKAKRREYMREYRKRMTEQQKALYQETNRLWRQRHPDRVAEYHRRYRRAHAEKWAAYMREYFKAHPAARERQREKSREWYRKHKFDGVYHAKTADR